MGMGKPMSDLSKDYYIHTGTDGVLETTTEEDIRKLVAKVVDAEKVVIYLHGGLISASKGLEKAKRLAPEFVGDGAHPVFFIWETGLFETIWNNWREIANEAFFRRLVARVMKWVVGKLTDIGGGKSIDGTLRLPDDLDMAEEFEKIASGATPYADLEVVPNLVDVTPAEQKRFEEDLAADDELQADVQAIVDEATPANEKQTKGVKGVTLVDRRSGKSLMSPDVVEDLKEDAAQAGDKIGIFESAKLIAMAGKIFWRVIRRFVKKRDHGVYETVVEEVLREFYIANVGAGVWDLMKRDAGQTFVKTPGQVRGGEFLLAELGRQLGDRRPEITIVGHSAGSIFACHMIEHAAQARADASHPLPADFRFKRLVFMAPAARMDLWAATVDRYDDLFEHFRMFSLSNGLETGYWEVPVLYPASLLYMISGLLEEDANGKSAFDMPITGMQRYYRRTGVYQQPEVVTARDYLAANAPLREVWSRDSTSGHGRQSTAERHGAFDKDDETLASLKYII